MPTGSVLFEIRFSQVAGTHADAVQSAAPPAAVAPAAKPPPPSALKASASLPSASAMSAEARSPTKAQANRGRPSLAVALLSVTSGSASSPFHLCLCWLALERTHPCSRAHFPSPYLLFLQAPTVLMCMRVRAHKGEVSPVWLLEMVAAAPACGASLAPQAAPASSAPASAVLASAAASASSWAGALQIHGPPPPPPPLTEENFPALPAAGSPATAEADLLRINLSIASRPPPAPRVDPGRTCSRLAQGVGRPVVRRAVTAGSGAGDCRPRGSVAASVRVPQRGKASAAAPAVGASSGTAAGKASRAAPLCRSDVTKMAVRKPFTHPAAAAVLELEEDEHADNVSTKGDVLSGLESGAACNNPKRRRPGPRLARAASREAALSAVKVKLGVKVTAKDIEHAACLVEVFSSVFPQKWRPQPFAAPTLMSFVEGLAAEPSKSCAHEPWLCHLRRLRRVSLCVCSGPVADVPPALSPFDAADLVAAEAGAERFVDLVRRRLDGYDEMIGVWEALTGCAGKAQLLPRAPAAAGSGGASSATSAGSALPRSEDRKESSCAECAAPMLGAVPAPAGGGRGGGGSSPTAPAVEAVDDAPDIPASFVQQPPRQSSVDTQQKHHQPPPTTSRCAINNMTSAPHDLAEARAVSLSFFRESL